MVDCPKIHLLPNLTKHEFQIYKQVELDEKIKFHTSLAFADGRKASNHRRKILKLLLFDSPSSELLFENQEHGKVPEIEIKLSIPVRGVAAAGIGDSPANTASPSPLRISHSRLLI